MSQVLSPVVIAAGGEKIQVPGANGEPREVLVRLLKIGQLPRYLAAVDNEIKLASILTGIPEEEIDALPAVSVAEINSIGHDLNFTAACRWAERRAKITEAAGHLQPMFSKLGLRMTPTPGSAKLSPSSPAS